MPRLTATGIARQRPPANGRIEIHDTVAPGLALRVTDKGTKSFVYRYSIRGRQKRVTIGLLADWTLETARDKARELRAQVRDGLDPAVQKRVERIAARTGIAAPGTVAEAIDRYEAQRVPDFTLRGQGEAKRHLGRLKETLGRRQLAEIQRVDLMGVQADLEASRGKFVAGRFGSTIKGLFSWLVERDYLTANPASGVRSPFHRQTAPARTRWLDMEEIGIVWRGATALPYPWSQFYRLSILTLQRRANVATIARPEIRGNDSLWEIPAHKFKGKRPQLVPLVPAARSVIAECRDMVDSVPVEEGQERGPYLLSFGFRGVPIGQDPVRGFTGARETLNTEIDGIVKAMGRQPLPPWHPHDFRRSFNTALAPANVGIRPHVRQLCLGHSPKALFGVTGAHYDAFDYLDDMRTAFETWADMVTEAARGGAA